MILLHQYLDNDEIGISADMDVMQGTRDFFRCTISVITIFCVSSGSELALQSVFSSTP